MNDQYNHENPETGNSEVTTTDDPFKPPQTYDPSSVAEPQPKSRLLPFKKRLPLLAGICSGIVLRFLFSGHPGDRYATMMAAFIYLSPVVVGAVTVYVAETIKRRSWFYYLWAPFLANVLFVVGTLCIMIEGWICAIVIIPLFAAAGALAGLLMGAICRLTNWPKQTVTTLAIMPFLFGALENQLPVPDRFGALERSVTIHAPAASVWQQIVDARAIRTEEVGTAWAYRIGVPRPLEGITQQTAEGRIRKVKWDKGVHFDELFTDWQENRYMRWTYRFQPDSFPPNALDDHVIIGGHYFDLKDTSYTLTPRGSDTELTIRVNYRISTQFNWYADRVAQLLLGNFEEVILDFYRHRSEALAKG